MKKSDRARSVAMAGLPAAVLLVLFALLGNGCAGGSRFAGDPASGANADSRTVLRVQVGTRTPLPGVEPVEYGRHRVRIWLQPRVWFDESHIDTAKAALSEGMWLKLNRAGELRYRELADTPPDHLLVCFIGDELYAIQDVPRVRSLSWLGFHHPDDNARRLDARLRQLQEAGIPVSRFAESRR